MLTATLRWRIFTSFATLESMGDVVVSVVPDEVEADMVCGMLAANGIRAWFQKTNAGAAIWTGTMATIGPIQVLVDTADAEKARELLA